MDTEILDITFYETYFDNIQEGKRCILEAFPVLFNQTVKSLQGVFTKAELFLMLDVMNGTMLTAGLAGQHLPANCIDGMNLNGFDEKWEVDKQGLIDKLKRLSLWETAIMEIWATGFWKSKSYEQSGSEEQWVKALTA
jgi:hypothetical protein